ncbi:MAG TPA: hypothetical protein VNL37_05015, partial [Candidatus Polarisedimenticolia bacterium]|nr:hypothetical protein [Candidatus Polarisedimenticolia bacterium]
MAGLRSSAPAAVAFVYHEGCLEHSNGPGHPERPERVRAVRDHLESSGLLTRLRLLRPDPCPLDRITRVHDAAYVEAIRRAC